MKFYEQVRNSGMNSYVEFNPIDDLAPLREQYKKCKFCGDPYVLGFGEVGSKILIVGCSSSQDDIESGVPFSSKGQAKVYGMIKFMSSLTNLDKRVYLTNFYGCAKCDSDRGNLEAMGYHKERLCKEIDIISPQVILFLGQHPYNAFNGTTLFHDAKFIPLQELREKTHTIKTTRFYKAIVTHTLESIRLNQDYRYETAIDLRKAVKELDGV